MSKSEFTQGRWWVAPPMFDGEVIYAPPTEKNRGYEVVAMGIMNKADARLIAAAPEMYKFLVFANSFLVEHEDSKNLANAIQALLNSIKGNIKGKGNGHD